MISKKIFEEIGFTKKETAVYLALLALDSASPKDIAKKAEINRTSCYDVLESLMKKGLVSKYKKKGKIFFQAGDPKKLIGYIERNKEEMTKKMEKQQEALQEALPELSALINPRSTKPKVQFFEGEKGMREAYEDTLTSHGDILAYANVETMHEGLPNFFPKYYERRAKANIHIRAIFPNNTLSRARHEKDGGEDRESVVLDDPDVTYSPEVNIYNDKVLITSWKEKMAVIVESRELADLQRVMFNQLWKALKQKG